MGSIEELRSLALAHAERDDRVNCARILKVGADHPYLDPDFMFALGLAYNDGTGVPINRSTSIGWMLAAYNERPDGRYARHLGWHFCFCDEDRRDYRQSLEWYTKGADAGDAASMSAVAMHYVKGLGVAKDYAKAIEWYERAHKAGDKTSSLNLYLVYSKAFPADKQRIFYWQWQAFNDDQPELKPLLKKHPHLRAMWVIWKAKT